MGWTAQVFQAHMGSRTHEPAIKRRVKLEFTP